MRAVVNDPRGTAFKARIIDKQNPQFAMGGKTGTAQVRRITEEERRNGLRKPEQVPWRERDHALFVGYAPVDDPKYVVAVVVEHGGGGSTVAAPIARDILHETLLRYRDRPDAPGTRLAERPA
jgi:penicillin-binding protein 2